MEEFDHKSMRLQINFSTINLGILNKVASKVASIVLYLK